MEITHEFVAAISEATDEVLDTNYLNFKDGFGEDWVSSQGMKVLLKRYRKETLDYYERLGYRNEQINNKIKVM